MYLNPKVRTGQRKLYLGGTSLCPQYLRGTASQGKTETSQVKKEQLYPVSGFLPKSWGMVSSSVPSPASHVLFQL